MRTTRILLTVAAALALGGVIMAVRYQAEKTNYENLVLYNGSCEIANSKPDRANTPEMTEVFFSAEKALPARMRPYCPYRDVYVKYAAAHGIPHD